MPEPTDPLNRVDRALRFGNGVRRDDIRALAEEVRRLRAGRSTRDLVNLVQRAMGDPGQFTPRAPDPEGHPRPERLDQWVDRALSIALAGVDEAAAPEGETTTVMQSGEDCRHGAQPGLCATCHDEGAAEGPAPTDRVVDLMDALERSVAEAKAARGHSTDDRCTDDRYRVRVLGGELEGTAHPSIERACGDPRPCLDDVWIEWDDGKQGWHDAGTVERVDG